jgi:Zn-dependent M32 family carboxypeptidase
MNFRTGLIVGGAIGYIYGTKAGREKYDQLLESYDRLKSEPTVQRVMEEIEGTPIDKARQAIAEQLRSASQRLRDSTQQ